MLAIETESTETESDEALPPASRAINCRFLLLTMAIVAASSIALYFVHRWQVNQNATVFREQAETARQKGESKQAVEHYARYLGFRPDDTDARAQLGMLYQDNAKSAMDLLEAYLLYEKVLLEEDNRDEIRQRLIDVAIRLGRFSDAESHIHRLLQSAGDSAELEYKLGVCAEFQNKPELAAEQYQKAIRLGYREPIVFLQLVGLLSPQLNDSAQAETLIDQMIEANPESVEAILVRAGFRLNNGKPEEARKDLARVEDLDPGNIESVLLRTGTPALGGAWTDEALDASRSELKLAIERKPTDSRLYQRLSQLNLVADDQEAALQVLRSGIAASESPGELIVTLGELLISEGKLSEAEEQLQRLRKLDGVEMFVDYLDGRLLTAKDNFPEAVKFFRRVQPQVAEHPQMLELCSLWLASCFEAMGEPDEQISELRQALSINPQAEQTALRLASALLANGKTDEALDHYRQLSHLPGVPLEIALIEFQSTLRQPPERRDWSKLEAMVEEVAESQDSSQVALLRHQIMMARGQLAAALDLLKKLHAEAPSEMVTGRLVQMLMSEGAVQQAGEVIDETEKKLGDTVALRIVRAQWINEAEGKQADEALGKLESGSDIFSKDDQFRLFTALADLHDMRGTNETAYRLRSLAAAKRPQDRQTQIRLMESAAACGQMDDAARHLHELRQIAGTESPDALAAEAWLLANADKPSQANLDRAVNLLSKVSLQKPDWYRVPFLLALVNERECNLDLACQKYREAIELGDREPTDIARLMSLYSRLERFDSMEQILNLLTNDSPPGIRTLLRQMKAELALNRGDFGDVRKLVDEAIPKDSRNPQEQVWLGAMLEKLKLHDDAEVAYREAVRLDPHQANSWIALINFLNQSQQPIAGELASARAQLNAHADSGDFARLFEAAMQFDEAETSYKLQLSKDPRSAAAIQELASFYQRTGQAEKAEPYLRSLLEPDRGYRQPVVLQSRRSLAGFLAFRDHEGFQESLALLDANIAAAGDTTNDLLAKAGFLAVSPSPEHLQDATLILKDLDGKGALNSSSRVLLAQLYDAQGSRKTADKHWQQLLGPNAQANHIAMYVLRQLQNGNLEDVPPLLTRLQKLEPDGAVELSFRWQVQSGNASTGIDSLTKYLAQADPSPDLQARRIYQVAQLVESVASGLERNSQESQQLLTASEAWYREVSGRVPEATLALARLLGRTGRISEALKLCDGARTTQPGIHVGEIAMRVVREPGATADDVALVERWLKEEVVRDANSDNALVQLCEFGIAHERYQQSIDLYERLLQQSPDNVIVLNNLAWLLSIWKGEQDRAEKMMDRAIVKAGPIAALLDTRGTIRMNSGHYDQAIADFQDALLKDDGPTNRFHLALAYWKSNNAPAALLNLRNAINAGFRMENLAPLEQHAFTGALNEMQTAMGTRP